MSGQMGFRGELRVRWSRAAMAHGLGLLVWPSAAILTGALRFGTGSTLSSQDFIPLILFGLGFIFLAVKAADCRHLFRSVLSVLGFSIACSFVAGAIASRVLDISYDGLWYHQVTALRLAGAGFPAWNPFTQRLQGDFADLSNCYPRGLAVCFAYVQIFFGNLEAGKGMQFLLMGAAWLIVAAVLLKDSRRSAAWSFVLAALLAANPVVLVQLFTFMSDGALASMLLISYVLAYRLSRRAQPWLCAWWTIAIIWVLQLKISGLVFLAVPCVMMVMVGFWRKRKFKPILYLALAAGLGTVLGIFWVGYSPYVTNFKNHQHNAFYPIRNWGNHEPFELQVTPSMRGQNRLVKLGISLLSESFNRYPMPEVPLKYPFQWRSREFESLWLWDTRVAGFGPWFSGALSLALLLMALMMSSNRITPWRRQLLAMSAVVVLVSSLSNPQAWWARLAPQLWHLPILPLWVLSHRDLSPWARRLGLVIAATLFINVLAIALTSLVRQVQESRKLTEQMEAMRGHHYTGRIAAEHRSIVAWRLKNAGVEAIASTSAVPVCGNPLVINWSNSWFCLDESP